MKLIASLATLVILMVGVSHAEVINGAESPELIPDNEAYLLFFMVMRQLPPPHWDLDTKMNYLKDSGLTRLHVQRIVEAADRYFGRIKSLDEEIRRAYSPRPIPVA